MWIKAPGYFLSHTHQKQLIHQQFLSLSTPSTPDDNFVKSLDAWVLAALLLLTLQQLQS